MTEPPARDGAGRLGQPGLELAGALFVWAAFATVSGLLLHAFAGTPEEIDALPPHRQVELGMAAQLGGSLVALAATRLLPSTTPLVGRGRVLFAVAAYFAFVLVWAPLTFVLLPELYEHLDIAVEPQQHLLYFTGPIRMPWFLVVTLTVVAVGPVVEEVVFRGYLQAGIRGLAGRHAAVWIAGALFGLLHVPGAGWHAALPLALLGAFFGWLREKSGGLAAPIAAHALHNLLTVSLAVARPELLDTVVPR